MQKKMFYQAGILACLLLFGLPGAEAGIKEYSSGDGAGANVLDYIENVRRLKRMNQLSEDQAELQADLEKMKKNLRQPVTAEDKQPVSIEGDDMFYDQETGAVYARGNVRVTQLDGKRVISDRVDGNLKTTEYKVEDLARMLQMGAGFPPMRTDGYHLLYNFTEKTGSMENVRGKNGTKYFYAKHMELYPEKVVLYDGWQSECSAENPHLRMSAKTIELYDEYMVIHKARYYLGSVCVFGKKEVIKRYDEKTETNLPNIGFDNEDGLELEWRLDYDIVKNTSIYADIYYRTGNSLHTYGISEGFKNKYGFNWHNAGNNFTVEDGQYKDSDDRWLRKHPTFKYSYSHALGKLPLTYTVSYENGLWKQYRKGQPSITSRHKEYAVSLAHRPIYLFGHHTWLNLSGGYSIMDENLNSSKVKGMNYDGTLFHEAGKHLVMFAGYHYSKSTTQNSVFDFDLDSYSKKFNYGLSLELGKHDRFVMANEMDVDQGSRQKIDYYWFHDFHCMTGILKYRERDENEHNGSWKFKLQFTPW